MNQFISKVKNLSQKAAEIKAAIQSVPPKVAEIREAMAATTGQLQQLKSEIHHSVADLKADQETHLSEALQEIHGSAEVFAKAGFVVSGVDLEISPVQRILVHLTKVEDVHISLLRAVIKSNEHRKTTRAVLSSLLQAKQMADTVELGSLVYDEVVVGIGPIPSIRLCWRTEEILQTPDVPMVPAIPTAPALATTAPAALPPSAFGSSSFFERREVPPAASQPLATAAIEIVPPVVTKSDVPPAPETEPAVPQDPLARFKKMPNLSR